MTVISIIFIIKKWMDSKTPIEIEETPEIPRKPEKQKISEKKEQLGDEAKEEITTAIEQEQKEGREDKEKMTDIPNTFGVDKVPCAGCNVTLRISTIKRPVVIECPKCGAKMNLS
jgi:Zn-dependent M16 (insulinase) family peptidase